MELRSPTCAYCRLKPCYGGEGELPANCPMVVYPDVVRGALEKYVGFVREMHRASSLAEVEGYCVWPRLREVVEFARKLGIRRIGLAFCIGLAPRLSRSLGTWRARGLRSTRCAASAVQSTRRR